MTAQANRSVFVPSIGSLSKAFLLNILEPKVSRHDITQSVQLLMCNCKIARKRGDFSIYFSCFLAGIVGIVFVRYIRKEANKLTNVCSVAKFVVN